MNRDMTTNHIYYNISVVNNEEIDDNKNDPNVSYNDVRDVPLLDDASQYYFSIVRFQLNGIKNIPLFIPTIKSNYSTWNTISMNETIYKVSIALNIQHNGQTFVVHKTRYIEYKSQNKKSGLPNSPTDYDTDYYFCYTYSHILELINETYIALNDEVWVEAKSQTGITTDTLKPNPPYMDRDSGSFVLYLDKKCYGRKDSAFSGSTDVKARMFFNSNMYGLFSNFHHNYLGGDLKNTIEFNGTTQSITDCAYDILPTTDPLGVNEVNYGGNAYHRLYQDFPSTDTIWSPVDSIVFTTNLVPILPENTGEPLEFTDEKSSQTTISNYEKVITDMVIPFTDASNPLRCLTYVPQGEYRLTEFAKSKITLRNIQINGFFKMRKNGLLVPLKMFNQSSLSFKIMFRRRGINL